jgi:hypothetical protein
MSFAERAPMPVGVARCAGGCVRMGTADGSRASCAVGERDRPEPDAALRGSGLGDELEVTLLVRVVRSRDHGGIGVAWAFERSPGRAAAPASGHAPLTSRRAGDRTLSAAGRGVLGRDAVVGDMPSGAPLHRFARWRLPTPTATLPASRASCSRPRASGGTGRRARLRAVSSKEGGGSSPLSRTSQLHRPTRPFSAESMERPRLVLGSRSPGSTVRWQRGTGSRRTRRPGVWRGPDRRR